MSAFPIRLSRFDILVMAILALALGLTVVVVVRGDQVDLRVVELDPGHNAKDVPISTALRVTFSEVVPAPPAQGLLKLQPPAPGTTRWEGKTLVFQPAMPLQADVEYSATVAAGLISERGRRLQTPVAWQFRTRPNRLFGLGRLEGQRHDLLMWQLDNSPPIVLASAADGIWDFAPTPDGRRIVYSALRPDGGSDLWLASVRQDEPRRLLDCGGANCTGPAWSPDGSQIIYERSDAAGPPRLWWLDLGTTRNQPLFEDPQMVGFGARWSPDGKWISYVEPLQGVRVYNLETGNSLVVPSQMGEPGAWSPGSDRVVITDIRPHGEDFAVHLLAVDIASEKITDLSGADAQVEDNSPIWSPDGRWIAFGRKTKEKDAGVGSQIWLVTPNGTNAHPLTNDVEAHFGALAWSPDGRYLAAQRYRVVGQATDLTVMVFDTTTDAVQELGVGAFPIWAN